MVRQPDCLADLNRCGWMLKDRRVIPRPTTRQQATPRPADSSVQRSGLARRPARNSRHHPMLEVLYWLEDPHWHYAKTPGNLDRGTNGWVIYVISWIEMHETRPRAPWRIRGPDFMKLQASSNTSASPFRTPNRCWRWPASNSACGRRHSSGRKARRRVRRPVPTGSHRARHQTAHPSMRRRNARDARGAADDWPRSRKPPR